MKAAAVDRPKSAFSESEASDFQALFALADIGIVQVDAVTRRFLRVNRGFADLVGYTPAELAELSFLDLTHPEDEPGIFDRIVGGESPTSSVERRLRRKDGTWLRVNAAAAIVRDAAGRPLRAVAVIQDITERNGRELEADHNRSDLEQRVMERTAELDAANGALRDEILERAQGDARRRELMTQLVTAQEDERRRLSRELHDQLGQLVTGLIIGLKSPGLVTDGSAAQARLQGLQQLAESIGKEIHDLALALRPTALDDLGLVRTLETFVEEWSRRAQVEVDFHAGDWQGERLPPEVETTIYRIVCEAFTNIHKHASANRVSLILKRDQHQATAIVEDDGCGFALEHARLLGSRRLGLLGMRERAALVRGEVEIEAVPDQGTTVFVRIPLSSVTSSPLVMPNLKILLADDHAVVREGLKRLIESAPDMDVIAEAEDGNAAIDQATAHAPDVVVMDISMRPMGGAQATREVRKRCPSTHVLALTVHEDRSYLQEMFEAGASGYVLKRAAADELVAAIRMVAGGSSYVDARMTGKLVSGLIHPRWSSPRGVNVPSERESSVMRLIARGYTNKEIAAQLNVSVKTVETYKARAMEKLGLRTRVDIVRMAADCGWLRAESH